MNKLPIGVLLESFQTDYKTALKNAHNLGLDGIQIYATRGEFNPENLSTQRRKELLNEIKSYGLKVSALCGDLGMGFGNAQKNPQLIEKSKRILELAKDLETNIVTTHIGVVPDDENHPRYEIMHKACLELSEYADSLDAHFAIETGPEKAITLKNFLDKLNSKGVAVNMDPANFVMVTGDDPVKAVYTLKDYIVHTHAKDGVKLKDKSPEILYGIDIEEEIKASEYFKELPLGQGNVDFKNYLKALDEINYTGFLTIEREVGENPCADIELATNFLRKFY